MTRIDLDAIDIRILSAVQQYGRLSKTELAEIVNLSPTPCLVRLNKLKAAGYILGYRADIALNLLGDFTQVIVTIALTHHRKSDFEKFENRILAMKEVVECIATGGGMDYVLKIFSPSLIDFQNLMDSMLSADLGIDRYMTYIVTRNIKQKAADLAQLTAKPSK